jgi:hypothetical protein
MLSPPLSPWPAFPPYPPWRSRPSCRRAGFKSCDKQADVDICNVQNITTASTGQLVTALSLVEVKGKVNRKVFSGFGADGPFDASRNRPSD